MLIFQWFGKTSIKWTGLNWRWLVILSYTHIIIPKNLSMPTDRAYWYALIPCMSWILNRRTHTAILHIKYRNLLKTALRFYGRVFQCPLSTQLSQCSVLLQKFLGSEQSTLGHYIPQGSTEGRYSIRRQVRNFGSLYAAFTTGVFSVRVNPRDIWHLPNAVNPASGFSLVQLLHWPNHFHSDPKLPQNMKATPATTLFQKD